MLVSHAKVVWSYQWHCYKSKPVTHTTNQRQPIHNRNINSTGYLRDDGLWDIEAVLIDTKDYYFESIERGTLSPGEHVHNLTVCVTLDDSFTIRDVNAVMEATPFQLCKQVPPRMKKIVGITIGKGWIKQVLELLGGTQGCTHFIEMLKIIATTAYQTIHPYRIKDTQGPKIIHPSIVDQCQGFASDGSVVQQHFPEYSLLNVKETS